MKKQAQAAMVRRQGDTRGTGLDGNEPRLRR
jgi:hypothetical protein